MATNNRGLFHALSIIQGETLDLAFDISVDGEKIAPTTLQIAGQFASDDPAISNKSLTFSVDPVDPYVIHAKYSAADSASLMAGDYKYDIRINDSTGTKVLFFGPLTIHPSIVR